MYITNPTAPDKPAAKHAAERIARALRAELPEYEVRIDESIRSRYHVVIEVPFRVETLTWADREAAKMDRTNDTMVQCAVCGTRTTWGSAKNWSSRLKPDGERFYLCAEDECFREESAEREAAKSGKMEG